MSRFGYLSPYGKSITNLCLQRTQDGEILSIYQSCHDLVISLHMVKGNPRWRNIINISVMSRFGYLSPYGKREPKMEKYSNKRKSKKYFQMKKLCAKTVKVITGRA